MSTSTKKFSGWGVIFGSFLLSFLVVGIVSGTAPLFMRPITTQFGFDPTQYSLINLVASFTSAFGALYLAPKMQKGNMKTIMLVAAVITAVTYGLMAVATKLWQFMVIWGVSNAAMAGVSQLPVAMLATAWFQDKRSIAMGISLSGVGLGTAVWSAVWGKLIAQGKWQLSYMIGGVIIAAGALVAIVLFIKQSPAQYGQTPYVDENKKGEQAQQAAAPVWLGVSKKVAVKSMSFVMMVIVVFSIGWLAAGVATHSINYLIGIGWSTQAAASVQSVYGVTSILAVLLGGVLFDKLGLKGGTFLSLLFAVVGLVGLILAEQTLFGYVYAVGFALAMSLPKLMPAMLVSAVFGTKEYGAIYSLVNLFFLIGAAVGSVLTGIIDGLMGYRAAWIVFIVLCVVVFLCTSAALAGGKALQEKYPNGEAEVSA